MNLTAAIAATQGCTDGGSHAIARAIAEALHRDYGRKASTVAGVVLARVMELDREPNTPGPDAA